MSKQTDAPAGRIVNQFQVMLGRKGALEGKRITLKAVQGATGLAWGTVQKWGSGDVSRIETGVLVKFCEYFECQPGDLLIYIPPEQGQGATQ